MRIRRSVIVVLATLALAACVPKDTPGGGQPSSHELSLTQWQEQSQQIAADRSKALLAGDEQAWLSLIDPSQTESITAERMRFRNLRAMRPQQFALTVNSVSEVGDPAGTGFAKGATLHKARIHAAVRYEADLEFTLQDYDYVFLLSGGKVSIASVKPIDAAAVTYGNPVKNAPWDNVPLRVAYAGSVTILAPEDSKWDPANFTAMAARANALVRGIWGRHKAPKGFLVLLATSEQKLQWFGATSDLQTASGYVYNPEIVDEKGSPVVIPPKLDGPPERSMAGSRIVLDMDRLKTVEAAERVLAHEMAHAVAPHLMPRVAYLETSPQGILNSSTWVAEGFAEWVEIISHKNLKERSAFVGRNWAQFKPAGLLPGNDNFYAANSDQRSFNYQVSGMFFVAAERLGGRDKTVQLYEDLVSQPVFVADSRSFLDGPLRKRGYDPDKFWSTFNSLLK
ncbi:hypothetical protein [Micromonospora vulcania]|uniref:Peptidase M48 domain-containing protein n=1 Tax=Micromonospora vulcania TaxID=1441873 RepID=A0ABW1GZ37_9ACTN